MSKNIVQVGPLFRGRTTSRSLLYENLRSEALEIPLVWESDVKELLREMRKNGEIEVQGLTGRETTPKVGHRIVWKKAHSFS